MVIFEQLIYLRYRRMVNFLKPMYLLLKLLPLMAADFVFIDDVDCPGEGGFDMYSFSELIELVLL